MTKEQAIQAMKEGHKVAHQYFTSKEWMMEKDGKYVFEDGCTCPMFVFWSTRNEMWWDDGWRIVK